MDRDNEKQSMNVAEADSVKDQNVDNAATAKDREEALIRSLTQAIEAVAESGCNVVGHFGALPVSGTHRTWWSIRNGDAVDRLLSNPDYKVAQILSVLGSEVRLAMLRSLLCEAKTAAELVSELGLGTTGQAYHHLRELERAGYVRQRSGGRYHFDQKVGRVYLTALALAADAGAEEPEEYEQIPGESRTREQVKETEAR